MPLDSESEISSLSAGTDTTSQDAASPNSSDTQNADSQTPASNPGDTPASTPDAPSNDREALLAVVKAAVEPKTVENPEGEAGKDATELASPTTDPKLETQAADPLEADPTDAELAGLVPKTKQRVQKLLAQRNEARTEVDRLKAPADQWEQFDGYLRKHDLAAADVNLLLGVGAALRRGDFKAFYDGVKPYVDLCREQLGMDLPADLQARVDSGEMAEDAAKEFSKTRLANIRLTNERQQATQAEHTREQEAAQTRNASAINSAITDWETSLASRDPDFASKVQEILEQSEAIMFREGRPTTPDAAVKLAQRCYESVNAKLAKWRPALQPTRPTPPATGTSGSNTRPEPKSMLDAVRNALRAP